MVKNEYLQKLKELVESSTMHGIPSAIRTNNIIIRIFWILAFIGFLAYAIYSNVLVFISFFEFGVIVKIEVEQSFEAEFPTVTICNINPIDFTIKNNYDIVSEYLNQSFLYHQNPSSDICNRNMDTILRSQFRLQGFSLDKLLIDCAYDDKPCDRNNFFPARSFFFGNCFSFNYGKNLSGSEIQILKSKRPGMINGFKMKLFVGTPEFQPCWNNRNGAVVVVHNRTSPPLFVEDGLFVQAGTETNIILSKTRIIKLPKPYSNCVIDPSSIDGFDSESYRETIRANKFYRQKWCILNCALGKNNQSNLIKCDGLNGFNYQICINNLENLTSYYEICVSECPIECEYSYFTFNTNSAKFPSFSYSSYLLSNQVFRSKLSNQNITMDQFRDSVLSINVYFDSTTYQKISDIPEMGFEGLLGNVGGQLGLFLGVSFLSFAEIFEIIFEMIFIFYKNRTKKSKVTIIKN